MGTDRSSFPISSSKSARVGRQNFIFYKDVGCQTAHIHPTVEISQLLDAFFVEEHKILTTYIFLQHEILTAYIPSTQPSRSHNSSTLFMPASTS